VCWTARASSRRRACLQNIGLSGVGAWVGGCGDSEVMRWKTPGPRVEGRASRGTGSSERLVSRASMP
jgi:hypothetical protein